MGFIERRLPLAALYVAAAAVLCFVALVAAEEEEEGEERNAPFNVQNTTYREECGSCHVPYPPELLSSQSWSALMSNLENHFGANASLDAGSARQINEFLQMNSGRRPTVDGDGKALQRISESQWFKGAHRGEGLSKRIFQSDAVRTPANCEACHRNAANGDYSEQSVRIPALKREPTEH